jgi:hypothetical protein
VYRVPKGNESSFRPSWRFSFSLRLIRRWRKREPESRELIQIWIPAFAGKTDKVLSGQAKFAFREKAPDASPGKFT